MLVQSRDTRYHLSCSLFHWWFIFFTEYLFFLSSKYFVGTLFSAGPCKEFASLTCSHSCCVSVLLILWPEALLFSQEFWVETLEVSSYKIMLPEASYTCFLICLLPVVSFSFLIYLTMTSTMLNKNDGIWHPCLRDRKHSKKLRLFTQSWIRSEQPKLQHSYEIGS